MKTSKKAQCEIKARLDKKLALSAPSSKLLGSLLATCASDSSTDNATFQYAFALSKSKLPKDLFHGIELLDSLLRDKYPHEVDCMIGKATAYYRLRKYSEARSICEAILRNNPENTLVRKMHAASIAGMDEQEESRIKAAAISGTVAVTAVGLAMVFGGAKKR